MLSNYCLLRRLDLPLVPCDECNCDWFVREESYNNCFWILANIFEEMPRGLSIDEIAKLEGISAEEVEMCLETAVKKYRASVGKLIKEM
jgi:hypothetical protein